MVDNDVGYVGLGGVTFPAKEKSCTKEKLTGTIYQAARPASPTDVSRLDKKGS